MENKYKVIVSTKARNDIYPIVDYWENTLEEQKNICFINLF